MINQFTQIAEATAHYLQSLARYIEDENSSEMSYRTPFQQWLESVFKREDGYLVQHDQRSIDGNKPDFVISRNKIPLLYIEVKKVGVDLEKIAKSDQATRYFGYTNLVITDYLTFYLFRNGHPYDESISLGTYHHGTQTVQPHPEQGERLARTLTDFVFSQKEPIKSGKHLAKIMGGKAQRIRENVIAFLAQPNEKNASLYKLKQVIQDHLVAELDIPHFADMYAQTLVYGLFAARYQDSTLESFTRQEARDLVPPSNPFLRHFFDHIAGANFPPRLDVIVTELCDVFSHADVNALISSYYSKSQTENFDEKDPIIHFYEDFLSEYDAAKKVEMGVFYTPQPVVKFIVRAVDELLKTEFGLNKGLADSSKRSIRADLQNAKGKIVKGNKEYHTVQVLDVATGTGTFLNEVVQHIHQQFAGQEGLWPTYAATELLPRLHGFELMMASYTIAHLKLGLTLRQTGVKDFPGRLGIYLTNTLEKPVDYAPQQALFGLLDSIAEESRQASRIKSEVPVMVVIGNPPYSGVSQNMFYTESDAYRVEPGGHQKLQERKHWLNDDYVKFIRFAETMIEKNGHGIVAMITAHGYIDNVTFRGMRWHLRNTFDEIYVLDLHGNSNKKETAPDGSKDENVFDIKTGVAILIGVKRQNSKPKKKLATVYKANQFGLRKEKLAFLNTASLTDVTWEELKPEVETWLPEVAGKSDYTTGINLAELFPLNTTGIVTMGDTFAIAKHKSELTSNITNFLNQQISAEELKTQFGLGKNYGQWINTNKAKIEFDQQKIVPLLYRPFDLRYTYFDGNLIWRPRHKVMSQFLAGDNIGIGFSRTVTGSYAWNDVQVTRHVTEFGYMATRVGNGAPVAPLYIYYPDGTKQANLDPNIWTKLSNIAGKNTTAEEVLDYVYGYLHSPSYRTKFAPFLKTDFPRVPWPKSANQFWQIVELGTQLRKLHLLEATNQLTIETTYPITGDNTVAKYEFEPATQRVWINDEQYFGNVSHIAWKMFIGGYQPAQRWLKDRKGEKLDANDLAHYQIMIAVLKQTDELMHQIDAIVNSTT